MMPEKHTIRAIERQIADAEPSVRNAGQRMIYAINACVMNRKDPDALALCKRLLAKDVEAFEEAKRPPKKEPIVTIMMDVAKRQRLIIGCHAGSRTYFVTDGYAIKIGTSNAARLRLQAMQTGNPRRLTLLASVPTTTHTETELHERFAHLRIGGGEWFEPAEELVEFILECRRSKMALGAHQDHG